LDSWLRSYEVFKVLAKVWACSQPLPMQQNLPKSTQNCLNYPKLPKSAQKQIVQETLKFHKKLRFWFFSKKKPPCVEGAPKHVHIVRIFNTRIFHMPFSMSNKKWPLYVNFNIPFVQNDVFFKVSYVPWI
jgi:hypothetical protein